MYITYLFKELTRRKGRTITNLIAVAVLATILIVLTSVVNAYTTAIYLPFQNMGVDMVVQKSVSQTPDKTSSAIRLPFGKGIFSQDEIDKISSVHHVEDVSRSLVLWDFDKGKFISIEGVDSNSLLGERLNSWITAGRFFNNEDNNKMVVEKHFAKFYGLKIGDSVNLGDTVFVVIGLLSSQEGSQVSSSNIYVNLGDAQKLLGVNGYSKLYVRLDTLSSEEIVHSEINQIDNQTLAISGSSIGASMVTVIKIYNKFQFLGFIIISIIVGFILFQVNATGLMERRKDIGIMQTVGWKRHDINRQILSEVFLQTIIGFILGIMVSLIIMASIGSINVQTNLSEGLSNSPSISSAPLTISFIAVIEFLALMMIISASVSLFLARRIAGMKPMANLRSL